MEISLSSIKSFINRRIIRRAKAKMIVEKNLDWSGVEPDFLDHLKHQQVREKVFKRIVEFCQEENFSSILEIGFGGANEYERMKDFFHQNHINYTGVDYTPHFVESAKERFPEAQWVRGDVRQLQFSDNSYDIIYIYHVLEHLKGYDEVKIAIQELCRVARKRVIIIFFRYTSFIHETQGKMGDDGFYYYKYSASDIWKAILPTEFEVRQISFYNNVVWELERKKIE